MAHEKHTYTIIKLEMARVIKFYRDGRMKLAKDHAMTVFQMSSTDQWVKAMQYAESEGLRIITGIGNYPVDFREV